MVKNGFKWILDNKASLIAALAGIVAGLVAFNVASIITGVTSAMSAMKKAVLGLNAAMKANPIGLIITAVGLLVAAFMYLWENCEGFRNFWINLWDGIKEAVSAVVDWFVEAWQNVANFFTGIWDGIKGVIDTVVSWIKENWQAMLLFLINPVAGIFKYLYDHFEGFRNFVDGVVKKVKGFFTGLWDGMKNGAKNAWEGIKNIFSTVADFFGNIFSKAWEKVKAVFSKGGEIFDGIKDGIVTAFKTVVNAIISGINKVVKLPFEGINDVLDTIHGLEIAGIKPFDWLTWRAPVPQIPQLAKGGVVSQATTAVVGEDGKEAIVPLERNLEWIDKVADKVAEKMGGKGGSVIVNQTNNYAQAHTRYEMYKSKQQTAAAVRLALQGG